MNVNTNHKCTNVRWHNDNGDDFASIQLKENGKWKTENVQSKMKNKGFVSIHLCLDGMPKIQVKCQVWADTMQQICSRDSKLDVYPNGGIHTLLCCQIVN